MKNNVIDLPMMVEEDTILDNQAGFGFDFTGIDLSAVDKVFDVMNFLSNQEELISKFTPDVEVFLENEKLFKNTVFKKTYDGVFEEFILGLIKKEIVDHFNFTPEDIMILTDRDLINLLTDGYFFDKENYKRS